MSQPSSNKGKDPSGKKFASLNVNQTFKGTKVESRTAAGQTRHGMQSLGKVSQSRRVPIPANLPSLKKENLGNDPTVSLVPSGSSGWGKKEKNATKMEEQPQAAQAKPTKPDQPQEISLRPNAGAGFKNQSEQGKGWGNLQGGTSTPQSQPSSNVFQREFPKLGLDAGGQSTEESPKEQDLDKKGSASNNISNAPQRPAGDKWMPGQPPMPGPGPRPGGPPMDFSMPRDQQRPMFNGAPMQPPAGSQFYPYGPGMVPPPYLQMMPHPFPYPYPNRMPPPGVMGQPPRPPQAVTSESADRPATVKDEDIQNMEDDVDDEGWAGAQEDVDYNVKLKFDESDEEPEMPPPKASTQGKEAKSEQSSSKDDKARQEDDSTENKAKDGPVEAWGDHPPGYQGQMQFRPPPQQWMRGPFPPQFDPSRGPPPQGYPYPPHPWMYMNFRMQMPQQRHPDGTVVTGQPPTSGPPISGPPVSGPPVSGPPASMQTGLAPSPPGSTAPTDTRESERGKPTAVDRRKRQDDDERKEAERRGKAQAKLQALEEKIKLREEQNKTRRDSENSSKPTHRERMDSENSDSSRSGTQRSYGDKAGKSTKETPPRFLKQQSLTKANRRDDAAYSPSSSPFEVCYNKFNKQTGTRRQETVDILAGNSRRPVETQSSKKRLRVLLVGDSQLRYVDESKLANSQRDVEKRFKPGMRIRQAVEKAGKTDSDVIIVHAATNNAAISTPEELCEETIETLRHIQANNPNAKIAFSSIFKRKDDLNLNCKVNKVNELLADELALDGFDFIDNCNVMFSDLWDDGLHIGDGGIRKFVGSAPFQGTDTIQVPRIMKRHDSRSDDASSVHSHDSWMHLASDQEKGKDTEESVFTAEKSQETRVNQKRERGSDRDRGQERVPERDRGSDRRDRRNERHLGEVEETEKRTDKSRPKAENKFKDKAPDGVDGAVEKQASDSIQNDSSKSQRGKIDEKEKDSRRTTKFSDRRDSNRDYRSREEDRSSKRDYEDVKKDRVKDDRKNRDKDAGYKSRDRDEASRGMAKKDKETATSSRRKDSKDETKNGFKQGELSVMQSQTSEGDPDGRMTGDESGKSKSTETQRPLNREDKKSSDSYRGKDTQTKSKPPPENFKRLEKSKGKGLSMKLTTSKSDDKEKQLAKSNQVNRSDSKKPSAWSQIVSGETAEQGAASTTGKVEAQPKKSLIEIQKEEELKENERESNEYSKDNVNEATTGTRPDDYEKGDDYDSRRHAKPSRGKRYDEREYEDRGYDDRKNYDKRYGEKRYQDRQYDDRRYGDRRYQDKQYEDRRYSERRSDDKRYEERTGDDRYNRKPRDHYDDRFYDKRDYQEKRENQDKKEYQEKKRSDKDSRKGDERSEKKPIDAENNARKESVSDGKQDQDGVDKKESHGSRKLGHEDRKRRHDQTESTGDAYERIYSQEVEAEEKSKERRSDGQRLEKKYERGRLSERGRGIRGNKPLYSRGRGRGFSATRTYGSSKEGYPFKEMNRSHSGNISDQSHGSSKEANKVDASEGGIVEVSKGEELKDYGNKEESKEIAKSKENRDPEKKGGFVVPSRKHETRYESYKDGDRQQVKDYQDRGSYNRRDRSDNRKGRGGYSSSGSSRYPSKYENKKASKDDKEGSEESKASKSEEKSKVREKNLPEKEGSKDDGSDYEDDDEYTDEEDYEDQNEDAEGTSDKKRSESSDMYKEEGNRHNSSRGASKGQSSSRGLRGRYPRDPTGYEGSYKSGVPPRFQRQRNDTNDQRRGRGVRVRGSRGRGRASHMSYKTARGRGFGKPPSSKDPKSKTSFSGEKGDEDTADSDDDSFHSADDSLPADNEETLSKETRYSRDSGTNRRYSGRGRSSRGSSTRGRGARHGASSDHFLADRQQERVGHIDTSGSAVTLPAAGKASFPGNRAAEDKSRPYSFNFSSTKRGSASTRQGADHRHSGHNFSQPDSQEFSEPPKKMAKSKSMEKPDILRQFDVNNIASVVCIDDMPQNIENAGTSSQAEEDDGFVQVTSRKAQKFLREKQKEEEKRKLQEEMNVKTAKRNANDGRESTNKPGRAFKFVDHNQQRVTQTVTQATSQAAVTTVSQSQTSNAAMAAVGGWEPAQALLRGVQMVTPTENLEAGKTAGAPAPPPTMNAWKRPLSFAASLANATVTTSNGAQSVPDPKAVGTGKPNSSPAKQLPVNGQVSQANDVILVNGSAVVYKEQINGKDLQDLNIDEANMDSIAADKTDRGADGESKDGSRKSSVGRKTEQRKITKGTKRETAPRFQNMPKAKVAGNGEALIADGREATKVSATTDDVQEVGISKLQGEDRAPGKRPNTSKLRRCNSESSKEQPENGLIDFEGTGQPTLSFMRADIRTSAEKASAQISKEIKHRDDILESLDQTLGKVEGEIHSREEENAKDTARSVIKSLGDDDEKNLETRSLPSSTPPLVVEIHPPGPKGPSSDPGKGPVMPVPSSMSQEVSEMSMKVLSAKKLWDMPSSVTEGLPVSSATLTTWSEEEKAIVTTSVVTTSPTVEVSPQESVKIKEPTPVAVVKAQGASSKHEEDQNVEVSADAGLISKKTAIEQQNNVCKVKPQQKQQQPIADEKQILPSFSSNQLFASQFPIQPSYALPVHSSASKLPQQPYMLSLERADGSSIYSRERALNDFANHHAQPHAPLSLQQVRPASPISNQQQDVLQTNLMVGNIYGTPALQGTQQNALLWPVLSRHTIQPSTSLPYMSHPQSHESTQDLSSSPASFSSAQLYMAYDQSNQSVFSTQRLSSQMQQTPALGLVLQQPQLRTGSLLNVMQAGQNSKDSSMFSLSSSPNPFHQGDLQLMGMSQSDMTKHVHAKPFQPSSRTPPGSQPSQQPQQHPASFLSQQQAKISSQINKLVGQPVSLHQQQLPEQHHSSMLHAEKRQLLQHHIPQQHTAQQQSQTLALHQTSLQPHSQHSALPHSIRPLALQQSSLQQASGQAQFIQQAAFQGSRIASVGPRSVQGRTVSTPTPLQAQTRLGALSPVDQSMSFIHGGAASMKGISQPHQHSSLIQGSQANSMVPVLQHSQSLPANQHQTRPFTVRPSVQMQSYPTRVAPGPIQRPLRPANPSSVAVSNRPKQPVLPIVKNTDVNQVAKSSLSSGQTSTFRNEEHQKMIEETKKYFAAQQLKNEASIMSSIVGGAATPVTTTNTATTTIAGLQMATAKPAESIIGKPVDAKFIKPADNRIIRPPESKVIRPPENKAGRSAEGKSIKVSESKGMPKEIKGTSVESREGKPNESRSVRPSDNKAVKSGDFKGTKHQETKPSKTGNSKPTEEKASSDQKDLRDIAASAQLNDPTDIIAIIKSRPSLAKAFKVSSAQDKGSDRHQLKKSQSRDEKPVKSDTRPSSGSFSKGDQKLSAPKGDQKTGVAKPLPQRSADRSKRAERVRNGSNRGKSSN